MKQPELGRKIVELRKQKGLTQEELVEKCNINVRTLQRIESGEVNPRSFTVKILFSALDYDVDEESLNQSSEVLESYKATLDKVKNQIQNNNVMKNSRSFFYDYFLATGVVWFLCALAIVIFKLNFQVKEILLTIVVPLAFSIFRQFTKNNSSQQADKKESQI
ncbi:transcriptional regulator with XRE-family HTH domain [Parabacteroides sp. PFB2-12]|uniref:helix-turn-helix domain-containing protein n=1 Tax=unclassified Parabacteroides TaxID=2649774 RepID=UPI002475B610|nr:MULTISPECIES: helix-turn-helix domain-containing protein [unclassified Parabacteroides]MDH6342687.1 transcriptional regulator with XRE-family HTH domain [Parabacteroides sp. PM6-13]MDH6389750.1 transcriptional regulator with XRE-family HTH domain [Parabacteroides sp. PFB2-12]